MLRANGTAQVTDPFPRPADGDPCMAQKFIQARGDACSHGSHRGKDDALEETNSLLQPPRHQRLARAHRLTIGTPSPSSVLVERRLCSSHTIGNWVIESHNHTRSKSITRLVAWISLPKIFGTSPGLPSSRHLSTPSRDGRVSSSRCASLLPPGLSETEVRPCAPSSAGEAPCAVSPSGRIAVQLRGVGPVAWKELFPRDVPLSPLFPRCGASTQGLGAARSRPPSRPLCASAGSPSTRQRQQKLRFQGSQVSATRSCERRIPRVLKILLSAASSASPTPEFSFAGVHSCVQEVRTQTQDGL